MDAPDNDTLQGLRLLVADDNSVNRTLLSALAANLGARCETVNDGSQAIARVLEQRYDCVILDLRMPEVDGYTAARAISQLAGAPPLLAFSADADPEVHAAIREAGFSGLLQKPLSEARLREAVLGCLRGEDSIGAAASADSDVVHDRAAAIEAAGGNATLAAELFQMLRDDLAKKRRQLPAHRDEPAVFLDLVHQIHGAAGHCRADRLRQAAARLEAELRRHDRGPRPELVDARHARLLEEIDALLALPDPFAG